MERLRLLVVLLLELLQLVIAGKGQRLECRRSLWLWLEELWLWLWLWLWVASERHERAHHGSWRRSGRRAGSGSDGSGRSGRDDCGRRRGGGGGGR